MNKQTKEYESQIIEMQKEVNFIKLRNNKLNFQKEKAILQQKVELLELQLKELKERFSN